jgi:hypothetical protein
MDLLVYMMQVSWWQAPTSSQVMAQKKGTKNIIDGPEVEGKHKYTEPFGDIPIAIMIKRMRVWASLQTWHYMETQTQLRKSEWLFQLFVARFVEVVLQEATKTYKQMGKLNVQITKFSESCTSNPEEVSNDTVREQLQNAEKLTELQASLRKKLKMMDTIGKGT